MWNECVIYEFDIGKIRKHISLSAFYFLSATNLRIDWLFQNSIFQFFPCKAMCWFCFHFLRFVFCYFIFFLCWICVRLNFFWCERERLLWANQAFICHRQAALSIFQISYCACDCVCVYVVVLSFFSAFCI